MEQFLGLAFGLLVVGIIASWLGGSIAPLVVIGLVIWGVGAFHDGLTGGKNRRR